MNEQGGDKHHRDAETGGCELPVCILTGCSRIHRNESKNHLLQVQDRKIATTTVASPQNHHRLMMIETETKKYSHRMISAVMLNSMITAVQGTQLRDIQN